MIKIGLLGMGTVGSGVAERIRRLPEFEVTHVAVRHITSERQQILPKAQFTTQALDVVQAKDVDLVIEVMGGVHETAVLIAQALRLGKHVVTANKHVIAQYGHQLDLITQKVGVNLCYEAAVGGGIPILHTLKTLLIDDTVLEFSGIVNGTTNFILSQMTNQQLTYDQALALAQTRGFAEQDPADDVEGFDATYKTLILIHEIFDLWLPVKAIKRRGITEIKATMIANLREYGYTIKPMIHVRYGHNGRLLAEVGPYVVSSNSEIGQVADEKNVITIKMQQSGQYYLTGPGAGKQATTNAILMDLAEIKQKKKQPINENKRNDYDEKYCYYVACQLVIADKQALQNFFEKRGLPVKQYLISDNVVGILTGRMDEEQIDHVLMILKKQTWLKTVQIIPCYK